MFSFVQEARDQTQPGSLFSRSWGRGERDPGNEVGLTAVTFQSISVAKIHARVLRCCSNTHFLLYAVV